MRTRSLFPTEFWISEVGNRIRDLGHLHQLVAVYLLTKNKSWHMFTHSPRDFLLAVTISANSIAGIVLNVKGMLWLGALGASVGFGIQQAMQMTGCQGVGFISGEWRGVHGRPRTQMYWAIGILMLAATIMVIGKKLGAS